MVAGKADQNSKRVVFLFTGQGSQYAGMGKGLYYAEPEFRKVLDQCAEILKAHLSKPLLSILWGEDQKLLDETEYTQPALFVLEYSLAQLWKSWGIEPQAVMGHSVGEYVAACVADVYSLEDGLKLISKRAKLMQALPRNGSMVAIAAPLDQVEEAIKRFDFDVSIAAINGLESIVISGLTEKVREVAGQFEAKGVKIKNLNVSHAFHSPLLDPMLGELEKEFSDIKLSDPKIPLISNLTGKLVDRGE